ncbi:hypothetical protein HPB50_012465 [Hyalomma asiaticum]|uniref:Uncharacterized protein n=1 Tax=Hyalomma asiaticum TaxID=266040 RepID=A0ACB7RRU4_HYAAI|nr:hypothetical protein HPB50_012465 [Hyalomma asiaticum]
MGARTAFTFLVGFTKPLAPYAAHKTCMRDVASRFDMSESSVHRILQRVAEFLMTLGPSVIKFPANLESLASSFEKIASVCQGRYHILGDAAYPLREYLLTPYRDYGAMTKQQKGFKFSGTRVLTENAFSTLKKRFRQLMYLELHTIHWLNEFIISCCILHTLCIDYGDEEPDDDDDEEGTPHALQWQNSTADHIDESDEEQALHKLGEIKRAKICTFMQ